MNIYLTQFMGSFFILWFLLFGDYGAPFCEEM